jgi:hypothetical protein
MRCHRTAPCARTATLARRRRGGWSPWSRSGSAHRCPSHPARPGTTSQRGRVSRPRNVDRIGIGPRRVPRPPDASRWRFAFGQEHGRRPPDVVSVAPHRRVGDLDAPASISTSAIAAGRNKSTVSLAARQPGAPCSASSVRAASPPSNRPCSMSPPQGACACQGWMLSRSSSRLGRVGCQPSVWRVWALDEGWSAAKIGPRGP